MVDPRLHFERQEAKNEVHGAAHEFGRLCTQSRSACSLSSIVVVQSHVIRKREPDFIDLQKVSNKLFFAKYLERDLLQDLAKDLNPT